LKMAAMVIFGVHCGFATGGLWVFCPVLQVPGTHKPETLGPRNTRKIRKARKPFVAFASFRDLRGPGPRQRRPVRRGDKARLNNETFCGILLAIFSAKGGM
jgi:hypothetical protein